MNDSIGQRTKRLNEIATELGEEQLKFYLHGLGCMQARVDMEVEAKAHDEHWSVLNGHTDSKQSPDG